MKQAIRALWRRPIISLTVILTMALGIGANTAILSLVYATLLRPFPFPNPDRIVRIRTVGVTATASSGEMSVPDLNDYRTGNRTFEDMGVYQTRTVDIVIGGRAYSAQLTAATSGVLRALAVTPVLGRVFDSSADKPGGNVNQAVLSYALWQSQFGADPNIVGKPIRTPMAVYTVAAVMPPNFGYPGRTQMWIPLQAFLAQSNADLIQGRAIRSYAAIGRLRPGVTPEQAQADLHSISQRLEHDFASTNAGYRPMLKSLRDAEAGDLRPYLVVLLGATVLVLLICCANVANLLLVSAADRARESSVRAALGSSAGRLLREFLTESVALSVVGGVLGMALSVICVRLLPRAIPVGLPAWLTIEISPVVLIVSLSLAVGTGILFGLAPALVVSRVNLHSALKEGSRGSTRGGRLRQASIVGEVALSLTLLISATLLLRSFERLRSIHPGFQPEQAMSFRISPYRAGRGDANIREYAQFYTRLSNRLSELPGILAVGATNNLPFQDPNKRRDPIRIGTRGDEARPRSDRAPVTLSDVTPGYFAAMGIPLLEGRLFNDADTKDKPMSIIVSKRSAERLFPNRQAVGQQLRLEYVGGTSDPWGYVVGVVGNVKWNASEDNGGLELYYPNTQYVLVTSRMVVRFQGSPGLLSPALRRTVQEVSPETAISEVKPVGEVIADTLWQQRLWSTLLAGFAVSALLLAMVGLYGLMAYNVRQRTREIGIRMALGAKPQRILAAFTGSGMVLALCGIVLGAILSLGVGHAMESLLFQVSALDPLTYVTIPFLLLAVTFVASAVPSWRASRLDPLVALRDE